MKSILFFPSILIIISCYNFFGRKTKISGYNFFILISATIFVFIFGTRVNFGIDHSAYLDMYLNQGASLYRCEWLWVFINEFFLQFRVPYQVFFSFTVFLQLVFIIKACKELNVDYFWAFIVFFIIYIFQYVNIIRQCIAISIIFLSYVYFVKKSFTKWGILVFIATGFHFSAILSYLVIPFFYFLNRTSIKKGYIYYFLLIFTFFLFNYLYDIIIGLLKNVVLAFGSDTIAKLIENFLYWKIPEGSGLGVKLRILAYLFMLPKMICMAKTNAKYLFFFRIFFFGLIGELIASLNMNLSRIFMYYTFSQVYLIPLSMAKINKSNILSIKSILFLLGIAILFFLFIVNSFKGINNTLYYFSDLDFSFREVYW